MLARHDCGIDVLPGAPDYGRPGSSDAPEVEQAIETLRRIYDFVVVDAGSTLSPCSAAALHVSDEVHLVANPDVPCLRNLQRLRDLVRLAGVAEDRVRYVLNRTSDVEVVPLREIEEVLGRHIDHRFTSDYRTVASALNAGVPLSTLRPGALRAELDTFARAIARALGGLSPPSLIAGYRADELRGDRGGDAAARGEVADHGHPPGPAGRHQVVEDAVGRGLVEDPLVAEPQQVVLQRLQLEAGRVGHVADADRAEVGQPGLRTHRRELRADDRDLVVPLGPRVGERLERRRRRHAPMLASGARQEAREAGPAR